MSGRAPSAPFAFEAASISAALHKALISLCDCIMRHMRNGIPNFYDFGATHAFVACLI